MTKKENIETRRRRILKRLAKFLGFRLRQDKDNYKTYWMLEVSQKSIQMFVRQKPKEL